MKPVDHQPHASHPIENQGRPVFPAMTSRQPPDASAARRQASSTDPLAKTTSLDPTASAGKGHPCFEACPQVPSMPPGLIPSCHETAKTCLPSALQGFGGGPSCPVSLVRVIQSTPSLLHNQTSSPLHGSMSAIHLATASLHPAPIEQPVVLHAKNEGIPHP